MAMKYLPSAVQLRFSASSRIHSFEKAVEELVYNALDANATSIAIRLHIEEHSIQVIDNGDGISKEDMNHVGKRYMTSKTVDLTTLKASPQFYGFQGQSLASLVEVSRVVNITSKTDQSEDTWEKSFQKGKEKDVLPSATRPSKGTTVDIKGFLYNLKIQKQAVNSLREIQNIKSFLECISLVHNNISISLRDNSKNEIIFQVNKCRNIYQTLATIFSLEKDKILELRVEKKCYGVTAYMGKVVSEENENHWVYLNGRFMPQCNLHHILDSNIAKLFNLKKQIKTKKLLKTACLEDEDVFKKHIPFYYVFITCPYDDYDFNTTSKQNTVEFKNWNEVTKLLDKLVQFYGGNVTTKENKIQTKQIGNKMESDTRDEVKKIMDRILKSNSRKLGISQLQNGVKGKIVKRCRKKNKNSSNKKNIDTSNQKQEKTDIINTADEKTDRDARILPIQIKTTSKLVQTELTPNHKNQRSNKKRIMSKRRIEKNISKEIDLNTNMKHQIAKQTSKVSTQHSDVLIRAFQHANSTMKKRCKLLSKNINKLQPFRKTRKNEVFSQYTIKTKNQHITVRKRVGKFVVHNVPAMPPKFEAITDDFCKKPVDKNLISSKDLLQTILPTQKQTIENGKEVGTYTPKIPCRNPQFKNPKYFENNIEAAIAPIKIMEVNERSCHGPQLTYDSHSYTKHATVDSHIGKSVDVMSGIVNTRFITKTSRDNFIGENDKSNLLQTKFKRNKSKKKQSVKYNTVKASVINELNEMKNSSYAIEFSNSNMDQNHNNYTKRMDKYLNFRDGSDISNLLTDLLQNGTCSLNRVSVFSERIEKSCRRFESSDFVENSYNATYTIRQYEEKQHHVPESNYPIIESISPNKEETEKDAMNKDNYEPNSQNDVNPLNICETVLSSPSMHYEAPGSMLTEDELIDLLNHQNTISNIQNESKSVVPNEDNYVNDGVIEDILSLPSDAMATCNAVEETSHHFNESKQTINKCASDKITYENVDKIRSPDHTTKTCNDMDEPGIIKTFKIDGNILRIHKETGMILENEVDDIRNNFQINVINRPRFVPKGMSQILGNRRRVHASDYYLDEDYFHENLYNEFNEAVETNTEIFEPNIDYVNNTTTKDIVKVNQKLSKDNASLNFDAVNLRAAELQGQVDDKFIAATIKGKTGQTGGLKKYLVLFDQHAVHERIRLESNLAEYMSNNEWKSVDLDEISIKLKRDEIHYLHNYKDKFAQLGLKWNTVDENEISITGIPQAIIGNNTRQVDIIMKSAKNLILEEIEAIKSQKGSICLYPKSIMNLVFSEACRYAIKFGDKLSHAECTKLLRDLSECKTPFQCAHGRPVMAVITELKNRKAEYKINFTKVADFKRNLGKL